MKFEDERVTIEHDENIIRNGFCSQINYVCQKLGKHSMSFSKQSLPISVELSRHKKLNHLENILQLHG